MNRITHLPYRFWCPQFVSNQKDNRHHRKGALKEQLILQLDYAYIKAMTPTNKKWQAHTQS
eukprot:2973754-Amphidinium_carterae.1